MCWPFVCLNFLLEMYTYKRFAPVGLGKILRNSQNIRAYYMINHLIRCKYFIYIIYIYFILSMYNVNKWNSCIWTATGLKIFGPSSPPLALKKLYNGESLEWGIFKILNIWKTGNLYDANMPASLHQFISGLKAYHIFFTRMPQIHHLSPIGI